MAQERYTNDVLNTTEKRIPNPEVGNNANTKGNWGYDLRELLLSFDQELSLTFNGNPNGSIQSRYIGRKLWDTSSNKFWICTTAGTVETAVWSDLSQILEETVGDTIEGNALAFAIAL